MWKKYNVIEKYCKCNAKNEKKYTIISPTQITDISNVNISNGGCGTSDASYGMFGTNVYKNAYYTSDMGTSWRQSDICGNIQNVRGSYMTRNGKYSVFGSDNNLKIYFSDDYGETYNYLGALFESVIDDDDTHSSINFNKCYLNESGTIMIISYSNGLYIFSPQEMDYLYFINIGEVYDIAANNDFTRIWVPTSNGTYFFSYDETSDLFSQLAVNSNWIKTNIAELKDLNGWSASSSASGKVIVIGAKQMNEGVFISLDYGNTFKNIVDVLDLNLYDSTINTGSISISGDGYKMIITVYQNSWRVFVQVIIILARVFDQDRVL